MRLEVARVGDSTGLIRPKGFVSRLNPAQGAWLCVTENADGAVRLSPYDPDLEKGMKVAEKAMNTYRNALAELLRNDHRSRDRLAHQGLRHGVPRSANEAVRRAHWHT